MLRDRAADGKPEPAPELAVGANGWRGMTDLPLNDGRTMPKLGMGTWQTLDVRTKLVVDRLTNENTAVEFRVGDEGVEPHEKIVADSNKLAVGATPSRSCDLVAVSN